MAYDGGCQSTSRAALETHDTTGADALLVDMVGWCIERYYYLDEEQVLFGPREEACELVEDLGRERRAVTRS